MAASSIRSTSRAGDARRVFAPGASTMTAGSAPIALPWPFAPPRRNVIDIASTPLGILVALAFIALPFVVRTVQPVLADLAHDAEEAALTLGATPWQIFFHVVLPALLPGVLTGASLAFARGLGEYG